MSDIYTFAYVEDEPTRAVLTKMISFVNAKSPNHFCLFSGFPSITRDYGNLKKVAQRFVKATQNGCWAIFITDLDDGNSVHHLCKDWFSLPCLQLLPQQMIFRIAVHEVESWIIADSLNLSAFFNISKANFICEPDNIPDPKQFLFNIIRKKCRKKEFRSMLPLDNQSVGIDYNPQLVKFITENWDIEQAMRNSPSLVRAVNCFKNKLNLKS